MDFLNVSLAGKIIEDIIIFLKLFLFSSVPVSAASPRRPELRGPNLSPLDGKEILKLSEFTHFSEIGNL